MALTIFDSHQRCNNESCTTIFDRQIKGVGAHLTLFFDTTLTRIKDTRPLTRSKCHQKYLRRAFESNFAIALIQVKGVLHLTQIKYGLWIVSKVVKSLCKDGLYHLRHMSKVSGKGEFSCNINFHPAKKKPKECTADRISFAFRLLGVILYYFELLFMLL